MHGSAADRQAHVVLHASLCSWSQLYVHARRSVPHGETIHTGEVLGRPAGLSRMPLVMRSICCANCVRGGSAHKSRSRSVHVDSQLLSAGTIRHTRLKRMHGRRNGHARHVGRAANIVSAPHIIGARRWASRVGPRLAPAARSFLLTGQPGF